MKLRNWLIPAIGAVALGFLAMPGQAAPVSAVTGAGSDLRIAASESAGVEQVHGRRYRYYRYHQPYWYYRPYRYHRYGYYRRPLIHFYFGPRRHYRHYHW